MMRVRALIYENPEQTRGCLTGKTFPAENRDSFHCETNRAISGRPVGISGRAETRGTAERRAREQEKEKVTG